MDQSPRFVSPPRVLPAGSSCNSAPDPVPTSVSIDQSPFVLFGPELLGLFELLDLLEMLGRGTVGELLSIDQSRFTRSVDSLPEGRTSGNGTPP